MCYKNWKVDSSFQLIELEEKIDQNYLYNNHRSEDDQEHLIYQINNLNGN